MRRERGDIAGGARLGFDRRCAPHHNEIIRPRAGEALRQILHGRRRCTVRRLAFGNTLADGIESGLAWIDVGQVVAAHIADRQFAEHVVEDRGRILDRVVALHRTSGFEAREREGVDILFQRHAVLQAERHCDGKVVDEGAQCRAFLVHVDEDFTETPVVVFASAQVDLVTADDGLLGVTLAAIRHLLALAHYHDTFDQPLDDFLGDLRGARGHRLLEQGLERIILLIVVADELRI